LQSRPRSLRNQSRALGSANGAQQFRGASSPHALAHIEAPRPTGYIGCGEFVASLKTDLRLLAIADFFISYSEICSRRECVDLGGRESHVWPIPRTPSRHQNKPYLSKRGALSAWKSGFSATYVALLSE